MSARARFIPQAWVNDNAVGVDPEGPTEWEIEGPVPADIDPSSYETDEYARRPEAPQWVQDWAGPFEVEILR